MTSLNLVDKLEATGPKLKYLLSTCSDMTEEKSGLRVCGIVLYSMAGRTIRLPQLVECSNILQDKREIVTLEMATQFSDLKDVAKEIPPYHPKVKVGILIGRDAPSYSRSERTRMARKEPHGYNDLI